MEIEVVVKQMRKDVDNAHKNGFTCSSCSATIFGLLWPCFSLKMTPLFQIRLISLSFVSEVKKAERLSLNHPKYL